MCAWPMRGATLSDFIWAAAAEFDFATSVRVNRAGAACYPYAAA